MAFDGIVTKAISSELSDLSGARIDKIFEPNKNNTLIGMYLDGKNYLLNICIEAQNCRIHLTTHPSPNPQVAPNFCMVLRKNLLGLHLKNIFTLDLERLVIMEFEGFDDVDDILNKKLIIELMGKHSNIILLDEQNMIIDSLRHIKHDDDKYRDIFPHTRYVFPESDKYNFLELHDFEDFYTKICRSVSPDKCVSPDKSASSDTSSIYLSNIIPSIFNGISKSFVNSIIKKIQQNGDGSSYEPLSARDLFDKKRITYLNKIYSNITHIIDLIDSRKLSFSTMYKSDVSKKDYYLTDTPDNSNNPYPLNFFIDDFYFEKETSENFKNYRNSLLKLILATLQKYDKRLLHINEKLKECENMENYRMYGELITANLYRFDANSNLDTISVHNYYDNNNEISIPLDKRFSINLNAKRYFKKYAKLKNALEIVSKQKEETEQEVDYIQSVVYELESAKTIDELSEIFDEISENEIFQNSHINSSRSSDNASRTSNVSKTGNAGKMGKNCVSSFGKNKIKKSKLTKNKNVSFNPIKYTIDEYTVLVGRNNKENDYLSLKYANKSDIWFHVKDFHGSHTILKFLNDKNHVSEGNILDSIPKDVIAKVAAIAALHSKAKNSSNVPVDYCEVRYVKKPSGSKPGMVIYTNYRTVNVNPA